MKINYGEWEETYFMERAAELYRKWLAELESGLWDCGLSAAIEKREKEGENE